MTLRNDITRIVKEAKKASQAMAVTSTAVKNKALKAKSQIPQVFSILEIQITY